MAAAVSPFRGADAVGDQPPPYVVLPSHSKDAVSISSLILSCNEDGMDALRSGDTQSAFEQFKYAEAILLANTSQADHMALNAVTCNNLGCYYKKVGKFHGALSYLRRALKMEVELGTDEVTCAGTHLNLCAVLSKLGKHDKAVQYATNALDLMNSLVNRPGTVLLEDDYAVLALAYHNLAMEREALQELDSAASALQTGCQVAKRYLGNNHPLSLALGSNCDAVLANVKNAKAKKVREKASTVQLPDIGAPVNTAERTMTVVEPMPAITSVRHEAEDWAKNEEALWEAFANKILGGSTGSGSRPAVQRDLPQTAIKEPPAPSSMPAALANSAAPAADDSEIEVVQEQAPHPPKEIPELLPPLPRIPAPYEAAEFSQRLQQRIITKLGKIKETHDGLPFSAGLPGRYDNDITIKTTMARGLTFMAQAADDDPETMLSVLDAERDGQSTQLAHSHDYRPNRLIKRQTRTSRMVRRSGIANSTTHRDKVELEMGRKREFVHQPWKSAHVQAAAASKIQQVWRRWYQYCQDNAEYMTMTWICATMIQSHWRSYHVRQKKWDVHVRVIQRLIRGFLVRRTMKKHKAAVAIQRVMVGALTRRRLLKLSKATIKMQKLARGFIERRRYRAYRKFKVGTVITLQRYIRRWLAQRHVQERRSEKRYHDTRLKVATSCQRYYRGWKGRLRADEARALYNQELARREAAIRIQSQQRRRAAVNRANSLRNHRLQEMTKAATFVRKMWLGAATRRKYLAIRARYDHRMTEIVTIQRFARGYVTRLRLWNEAITYEEQTWAAKEIQRAWRGYQGRVRWEDMLEQVWRREMGAALLQRCIRGFMARSRINKIKRHLARAEFEQARRRFKAAQRIQAFARARRARKRTHAALARASWAAVRIQRVWRGRAVRMQMWDQVRGQRATIITAMVHGYLVRRRRKRLLESVVYIQRFYRQWLRRSLAHRQECQLRMLKRKQQVVVLQRFFREELSKKQIHQIKAAEQDAIAAPAAE